MVKKERRRRNNENRKSVTSTNTASLFFAIRFVSSFRLFVRNMFYNRISNAALLLSILFAMFFYICISIYFICNRFPQRIVYYCTTDDRTFLKVSIKYRTHAAYYYRHCNEPLL